MSDKAKPEMRKYTVALDEGDGMPRMFQIDAAYYLRQHGHELIDFKDDDGKLVLTFPASRLVYILAQAQPKAAVTVTYASGGIVSVPPVKGGPVD